LFPIRLTVGGKGNVTKTFIEPLDIWEGGTANGYYDFQKDEIHVLEGQYQEERVLLHEQIHASRRNKFTFRLAKAAKNPYVITFFVSILIMLQAIKFIGPFFAVFTAYIYLVSCVFYEEFKAEKGVRELGETK
jgi:hypothetical protein